jgi:hypothetical protein
MKGGQMPAVNVVVEMTVDKLLNAVAELDEEGLAVFEAGFEQIWLQRSGITNIEAAQLLEQHQLPLEQQARVRDLLWKNREEGLTELEEKELDQYMLQMDQALEATAEELLKVAETRESNQTDN